MSHIRQDFLRTLEAGTVGLFFVQAVRFTYAALYARASSADLVGRVPDPATISGVPGVVQWATVQEEIVLLAGLLLLPLLSLIIRRWRWSLPFAVILVALGRSMALQAADFQVPAASLVVGAGLLYLALLVMRRPAFFPSALLLGFAGDQIIRALGDTFDRTWQRSYRLDIAGQVDFEMGTLIAGAAIALILLSVLLWYLERRSAEAARRKEGYAPPLAGQMNAWGGLALGALLFLEFTVLALPNAAARWSGLGYSALVPWLLAATTLPLVPEVRDQARRFAGMFDTVWRGWLWMLLLGLLLVTGRRYDGLLAGLALVFAQFLVGLTLWWLFDVGLPRHNLTGIAMLLCPISFGALAVGDYFTYDYAFVRDLAEPYQNVDDLLRSFRGMGLGLALVAALVLSIPMILWRRRIPWRGGRGLYTLAGLLLVVGASYAGAVAASGSIIRRPANADCLRIATFNIHGGYSQFFDPNLERVAQLVELNGVDILLLQEVDTGRMASFGVDQVLWLARRLRMESAFYPQNEALQGIAVLSRVPIETVRGLRLSSDGNQAAVMQVTLNPERLVADPLASGLGPLYVYNAWLGFRVAERDGQPIPEGEQDQNRQYRQMLDWIAAWHNPAWNDRIVVGGTFNFGPDSPLYRGPDSPLYAALGNPALQDPVASLRAEEAMTVFLVDGTAARFDYLWTYRLPLTGAMVDQSPEAARTSDHRSTIVAVSRREGIVCPP
ncbi:MAG: endonuclease/exonuclease/phosphatase family protein [Anaerolineae bacterium]|nr:endonuclease/exonuclease/phosphatase family protein [Anaerolineae bacterium]